MVAKILLTAHAVKTTSMVQLDEENLPSVKESDKTKSQLELIGSFEKRSAKACFDDAYRTLYSELLKIDKKTKKSDLEIMIAQFKPEEIIEALERIHNKDTDEIVDFKKSPK